MNSNSNDWDFANNVLDMPYNDTHDEALARISNWNPPIINLTEEAKQEFPIPAVVIAEKKKSKPIPLGNRVEEEKTPNAVYRFSMRWSLNKEYRQDLVMVAAFKNAWDKVKQMLEEIADDYVFQLECTETDNWHYQIFCKTKVKIRPITLAGVLRNQFPGIHIDAMHAKDESALKNYCMKTDSREAGPWSKRRIYKGEDLPSKLWPWQQKLMEHCMEPPNDRRIMWIYDSKGCTGKSKFCKYMAYHHKVLTLGYAKTSDLLNLVSKNTDRIAYFLDLTRAKPKDVADNDLYAAIESIKNGYFMNSKYDTKEVIMSIPHVVVFSNQLPNMSMLTNDRWQILTITKDKHIESYSSRSLNDPDLVIVE